MDLREYLALARRWWWLLLIGFIVGGGIGYYYMQSQPTVYRTHTTLMLGSMPSLSNNSSGSNISTQLTQSYAEMIRREPILRATVDALGLPIEWSSLRNSVSSRLVPGTQLFEITVTSTNPERAKLLADEVARQLIDQNMTPVAEPNAEQSASQAFVHSQLETLQTRITEGQAQLRDLEEAVELETTMAGIEQRQAEISALQRDINTWQGNYAALLALLPTQQNNTAANQITIVEPAIVPTVPIQSGSIQAIVVAAFAGLVLAGGLGLLIDYMDDTLKTPDDVEQILGVTTLGTIPQVKGQTKKTAHKSVVASRDNFSPIAEAYRILRTNLQFSSLLLTNQAATLLITSPTPADGKSTTAANLALVMAHGGKKIILVDADLRRPTLHQYFNLSNDTGLTSLLINLDLSIDDVLATTEVPNLRILTSGLLPPNPADILTTPRMVAIIEQAKTQADLVIFDSPPALAVTDASLLATQLDSTLVVIKAGETRSQMALHCLDIFDQLNVKVLGVVLNRFNPKRDGRYGYSAYANYYSSNGYAPRTTPPQQKQELPTQKQ